MKIVISNSRVAFGGGENWSLTASVGLAARGHDVVLLCDPASELRERATVHGGVRVEPLRVRGTGDVIALVAGARRFARLAPDIICANMEKEVRVLGVSARLAGRIPFVRRRGSDRGFRNTWGNRVTFTRLVDGIIVNSDATKASVLSRSDWIPEDKVRRIYNGIPDSFHPDPELRAETRQRLGFADDEVVVGIVGALSRRKGHETLFEAMAKVRADVPAARLLVVGWVADTSRAESEAADVKAACARHGVQDLTTWADPVADANAIYNAVDVIAMPSTNEGFGYVAAEAMRARTAVVVSDASSLPEVAGDAARVVPALDIDAWADALRELLASADLRKTVAEAGQKRVETVFSIDRMLTNLEDYFRESIKG